MALESERASAVSVGAVVLAAGLARRMGQPKVLLPWTDGKTILDHILTQLNEAGVGHIVVVTGHQSDAVLTIAATHHAATAHNPDYEAGEMLSTLKVGLRALPDSIQGALIVLGDQPSIQAAVVRQVMDAYASGKGDIVAPSYNMRRGHPILIGRLYWNEMFALPADAAPRDVINKHADHIAYVEVDTDSVLRDVDTPQEYDEERRRAGLI